MTTKKTFILGALALILIVGGLMYIEDGSILSGKITASTPVNKADSITSVFSNSTLLNGSFTGEDILSENATGGVKGGGFLRATSTSTDAIKIEYEFIVPVDLSGYKNIVYWVRSDEAANGITLWIDDSSNSDIECDTGVLTINTWTKQTCSLEGASTEQIDYIQKLYWGITDNTAKNGAKYDIDDISLEK